MPTHNDETLHDRYAREHETDLAIMAKMKPEEIYALSLELHNTKAAYDALHAEVEALQQKLAAFEELHGGELGLPGEGWPAYHKRKMETLRDLHLGRIDRLCTELEAARGLLNSIADNTSDDRARDMAVDFITGTPAPEVPDHTERNLEMARQALSSENQRAVPPEPIIAPPHPFDKPSLLKDCNVSYSNSSRPLADQGERQEAQVMARVHHNSDHPEPVRAVLNSIGRQLTDNAPLYAEPQPGPDVRALVSFALELIDGAREGGSFDGGDIQEAGVRHGLLVMEKRQESCGEHCDCAEYGFPAECYRLTPALAANRQAQQELINASQ